MVSTSATSPEDAVRQYLRYVEDPSQLRDEADIQRRTKAVLDATDPIDKLRALSELERASVIDEAPLRRRFVEHAKAWADAEEIGVEAFRQLRVPDDVLVEAGFDVPARASRNRGRNAGGGEADGRSPRATPVAADAIKQFMLGWQGPFVLTDIVHGIGGSPGTVRKAVDELIDEGRVERLGPIPNHGGPGRAPIQYARR